MILMTLTADVLELFIMFMGVIPIITPIALGISYLINTFVLAVILLWFIIKKEKGLWNVAGWLLEYIPYLNALPIRTGTCIVAIYLANHPKIKKIATGKFKKAKDNVIQLKKDENQNKNESKEQLKEAA